MAETDSATLTTMDVNKIRGFNRIARFGVTRAFEAMREFRFQEAYEQLQLIDDALTQLGQQKEAR